MRLLGYSVWLCFSHSVKGLSLIKAPQLLSVLKWDTSQSFWELISKDTALYDIVLELDDHWQ